MINKIFYILFALISSTLTAQKETLNTEFSLMLNKLLKHSVNEVLPNEIATNNIIFLDAREKEN